MGLSILWVILSVVILLIGAEISLDASEKVGKKLGMSQLAIGMLLVGFGTSMPEFFVSHIAGLNGKPEIAMGNLLGSNIANMFLILGLCAFIYPLKVSEKKLRLHLYVHLLLVIVLIFSLSRDIFSWSAGLPLIVVNFLYLYLIFKDMRTDHTLTTDDMGEITQAWKTSNWFLSLKILSGFALLYAGGELLVKGGSELAAAMGISDYVISAIFIAFGTSFPELVTALLSVIKKKDTDLIIGNIVGSNLFNGALILGTMGIYQFPNTQNFKTELVFLAIGAVVILGGSLLKLRLNFVTGIIFFSSYLAVVAYWTGFLNLSF
jgi:cation:H+ antiporter